MKKVLLAFGIVALTAALATAGPNPQTGILGSSHDMNEFATGAGDADPQGRVCAYCHTPHHAIQNGSEYMPLWAHQLNAQSFAPYSSATIDSTLVNGDPLVGPSRLCMSCHDGTIALDAHYGRAEAGLASGRLLTGDDFPNIGESVGIGVNQDLTQDHPIGFDYAAVAKGPATGRPTAYSQGPGEDMWIRNADEDGLPFIDNALVTVKERLYEGTIMTCATCHDVHNQKNAVNAQGGANYFVLAPQEDSKLCRTCHIK